MFNKKYLINEATINNLTTLKDARMIDKDLLKGVAVGCMISAVAMLCAAVLTNTVFHL